MSLPLIPQKRLKLLEAYKDEKTPADAAESAGVPEYVARWAWSEEGLPKNPKKKRSNMFWDKSEFKHYFLCRFDSETYWKYRSSVHDILQTYIAEQGISIPDYIVMESDNNQKLWGLRDLLMKDLKISWDIFKTYQS